MYYKEKRTIASLISGIILLTAYCIYCISNYLEEGTDLLSDMKFWATAILIFIGSGILLTIIVQIVFHIILSISNEVAKEISKKACMEGENNTYEELEITDVEDEMDKLISLKAMRNSSAVVGIGFVASLFTLLLNMPPAIMMNILFASFSIGSLLEGFSQLYFYRKGVYNG